MRVLVCGGRDFGKLPTAHWRLPDRGASAKEKAVAEFRLLGDTLETFKIDHGITAIIHGGAAGVDRLARNWGLRQLLPVHEFKADWKTHGKGAGPIRNAKMIRDGRPDVVIAFPGGKGTADCVRQARSAGIQVIEVKP